MAHDLSPWGMYKNADIIVKIVMIGLAIASIITWTIWIAKGFELMGAKRRLRGEIAPEKIATLKEASVTAAKEGTLANLLVHDALEEMRLSANSREKEGIKERVSFRLGAPGGRLRSQHEQRHRRAGHHRFHRAVRRPVRYRVGHHEQLHRHRQDPDHQPRRRCPGIAEALLATALGLVAAIPAVVIYNVFARSIAGYKAQVSDASAQVLLLVSRDLDHQPSAARNRTW
jgi:biopolymer transport protein ExbB